MKMRTGRKRMKIKPGSLQTDLSVLQRKSTENEIENEAFREFLRLREGPLDSLVAELNAEITKLIDCTSCGNCCRSLMINVSTDEAVKFANRINKSLSEIKAHYLEESIGGQLVINTIPCHFLAENKCTIYADRFEDCRAFPHLDKPGFSQRIFGTLMHYGRCPIIFNVIEELKQRTNFTRV
jgi:uncharacterized protein